MGKFILKHIRNYTPQKNVGASSVKKENNINENKSVMTTDEKIALAQSVLSDAPATKRLKRDKGLIERTESSKTILTEDNKELLND